MKILVTGASGFVGRHLVPQFVNEGHHVSRLIRGSNEWNPEQGQVCLEFFEGFDVVVHLAGKNLAGCRWTKSYKNELFQSRCRDTWLLAQTLSRVNRPPKVFLTASAVGYYGSRGDELVDETAPRGKGFLADLCEHWERSTEVLEKNHIRVLHARFGVILEKNGGMLARMIFPFKHGFGAVLGSGKQWLSWIAMEDLVRAISHLIFSSALSGSVNMCSPNPITNEEFSHILARALGSKVHIRIPLFFLRLLLGEMADEMLLSSIRVYPRKLLESGYSFKFSSISQFFQASR